VDTALSILISDLNQTGTNLVNTVSFAPFDKLSIRCYEVGLPLPTVVLCTLEMV